MLRRVIRTVAISGYRSIRRLQLPLSHLNVVTGANGSGKSSLYRALRLLSDASQNSVVASLAREGGLSSTLWAGPEIIGQSVRRGQYPVEGTVRQKPVALNLGFAGDDYGYSIELGYPPPPPPSTMFDRDPAIKRECIWHGAVYKRHASLVDRINNLVTAATTKGEDSIVLTQNLSAADSMLTSVPDPVRAPEMLEVRETIRRWRFYDGFRTDLESPVRVPRIGTYTPVLSNDGTDLPAALQTILEIGEDEAMRKAIDDAFPGSSISVEANEGQFGVRLRQHGLLRPLAASELSDGTLRYLLWTAALLSPRPPELMVLNEPETSLHPDLLPALARLIASAARRCQIIVVAHAEILIRHLEDANCRRLHLEKLFGETVLAGATPFSEPKWAWPPR